MARRRAQWPFAHVPLNHPGTCSECGRQRQVIVVMLVNPDDIPGSFLTLCWPCLGRDGDPLHHYR